MRSFWVIQQVCASKPKNLHPISELKDLGRALSSRLGVAVAQMAVDCIQSARRLISVENTTFIKYSTREGPLWGHKSQM